MTFAAGGVGGAGGDVLAGEDDLVEIGAEGLRATRGGGARSVGRSSACSAGNPAASPVGRGGAALKLETSADEDGWEEF